MLNTAPNSIPLYPKNMVINAANEGMKNNFTAAIRINFFLFFHILFISITPPRIINDMGVTVFEISAIVLLRAEGSFI